MEQYRQGLVAIRNRDQKDLVRDKGPGGCFQDVLLRHGSVFVDEACP
jgi:hypothetical protein